MLVRIQQLVRREKQGERGRRGGKRGEGKNYIFSTNIYNSSLPMLLLLC